LREPFVVLTCFVPLNWRILLRVFDLDVPFAPKGRDEAGRPLAIWLLVERRADDV
jgi:hypothetical protein